MNAALVLLIMVFTEAPGVVPVPTGPEAGAAVEASPLVVEARGECPSGAAVRAALLPVLAGGPLRSAMAPRVEDLGDRFEASAAGQTGLYVDAARDCTERARVAAVFIALALNPPTFQSGQPPAPRPPPSPAPVRHRWFELGLAARLDGTSSGTAPQHVGLAWGAELSAGTGSGFVGGVVTAGALSPVVDQFVNVSQVKVSVRQQRFPFSASLRLQTGTLFRFKVALDVGAAMVLVTFRPEDLALANSVLRLDTGGRASLAFRVPLARRLAPIIGVHAEYFPKLYKLDVTPLGTVGTSSRLWLGATAGLVFDAL